MGDHLPYKTLHVGSQGAHLRARVQQVDVLILLASYPIAVRKPSFIYLQGIRLIIVWNEEIKDILARTGGSAYLDESAAARYIVYDNTNWVS